MTQHLFIAQSHVSTWNILQLYNVYMYMYVMCTFSLSTSNFLT